MPTSAEERLARRRARLNRAFRSRFPAAYQRCVEQGRDICAAKELAPAIAMQVTDAIVAIAAVGMGVEP